MLVVERPSTKSFSITEIKTSDDAQAELVKAWQTTLEKIADDGALVKYSPDLLFRAGNPRIPVLQKSLADENEIIAALIADADRGQEAPKEVSADHLYLYALVSDTEDAGRVVMIKKQTPAKRAYEGKWWGLPSKELQRMETDPWQIHPFFDPLSLGTALTSSGYRRWISFSAIRKSWWNGLTDGLLQSPRLYPSRTVRPTF
jgi:hypothetical protein